MSAEINLEPGILTAPGNPPPGCYASEQDRFNAYVAAIIATFSGDDEVYIGPDSPTDTSLLWIKTNGPTGAPIAILSYSADDASWVRVAEIPTWGGISTGAGASYQIVTDPPYLTDDAAYVVGKTYQFIANHASVGASTFQVGSLAIKNIKIRVSEDLIADSILNNQVVTLTYDGVNMQMLSPVGTLPPVPPTPPPPTPPNIVSPLLNLPPTWFAFSADYNIDLTWAHGLADRPAHVSGTFVCKADLTLTGDEAPLSSTADKTTIPLEFIQSEIYESGTYYKDYQPFNVSWDDVNVYLKLNLRFTDQFTPANVSEMLFFAGSRRIGGTPGAGPGFGTQDLIEDIWQIQYTILPAV